MSKKNKQKKQQSINNQPVIQQQVKPTVKVITEILTTCAMVNKTNVEIERALIFNF